MGEIVESRKERLLAYERVLTEDMEKFVRVGMALKGIRDEKLYREVGCQTFKQYVMDRWEMSERHSYRLMDAADLRVQLPSLPGPVAKTDPRGQFSEDEPEGGWTERYMRELLRLETTRKAKSVAQKIVAEIKEAHARGEKVRVGSIVRKHVSQALGKPSNGETAKELPMFADIVQKWAVSITRMAMAVEEVRMEDLELFGQTETALTKSLASALERLRKAWEVPMQPLSESESEKK